MKGFKRSKRGKCLIDMWEESRSPLAKSDSGKILRSGTFVKVEGLNTNRKGTRLVFFKYEFGCRNCVSEYVILRVPDPFQRFLQFGPDDCCKTVRRFMVLFHGGFCLGGCSGNGVLCGRTALVSFSVFFLFLGGFTFGWDGRMLAADDKGCWQVSDFMEVGSQA